VLHDHVDVLNESIGGNPIPNTQDDPVSVADQAAVAAGVTVVSSSGDAGPFNNIGSPATTPGVIAVGGTTTHRVYRQTTRYGTNLVPGGWEDNNITALSSDGITEFNPHTVDVVAPGDRGWSLCSSDTTNFFGLPEATGPFTAPTTGTVNLAAVANTNPFDSAVTSTSGDVWEQSVNASAPYSPLTLNPGQKGTITLTITPNAPKGTVVHGFIGVDTLNLATASGDELINIPYIYKVG
jgi:hypothetical protein